MKFLYVGMLDAEPQTFGEYCEQFARETGSLYKGYGHIDPQTPGYRVVCPQGIDYWCSKKEFDRTSFPIQSGEKISAADVDLFEKSGQYECKDLPVAGLTKSTVVGLACPNGYSIVESSSATTEALYDRRVGMHICCSRIKDKVWEFLDFVHAWARNGVKNVK